MPAVPTARTSVRVSYWPWSASPNAGESTRRPARVTCRPSSTSSRGFSQRTTFGPAMPTLGDRRTASTSRRSAVGCGATVSSRTHSHSGPVGVVDLAGCYGRFGRRRCRFGFRLTLVGRDFRRLGPGHGVVIGGGRRLVPLCLDVGGAGLGLAQDLGGLGGIGPDLASGASGSLSSSPSALVRRCSGPSRARRRCPGTRRGGLPCPPRRREPTPPGRGGGPARRGPRRRRPEVGRRGQADDDQLRNRCDQPLVRLDELGDPGQHGRAPVRQPRRPASAASAASSAATTTSRSGGRVWAATASRTSGSRPTRVVAATRIPESDASSGRPVARGRRPGRGAPPSPEVPPPRGARTRLSQGSPDAQRGAARASSSRGRVRRRHALDSAFLQLATLALGQAAPDAEALVVGEGILQALGADLAADADLLGLAGRAALLREERLRVGLGAERALLPGQLASRPRLDRCPT